jgi:hypothetical protein
MVQGLNFCVLYEGKKPKIDKPEIKNEPKMQETLKSVKA